MFPLIILGFCSILTLSPVLQAETPTQIPATESPLLPWATDFEKTLETAKADSLPIYLYFTGSSWCIWCKKMDREIHNQDSFRQKTVGKILFVRIDLPAGTAPSEQTKKLIEKYNVHGVPTVLILSPKGEELARFRYQHISPEEYAKAVLEAANTQ